MKSSWERIDEEVGRGLVTKDTLVHFQEAELYGTASPMQWLGGRLQILEHHLQSNDEILVFDGELMVPIADIPSFYSWGRSNLPDAFACFFPEDRENSRE